MLPRPILARYPKSGRALVPNGLRKRAGERETPYRRTDAPDEFTALLVEAGARLPDGVEGGAFEATMRRFVPHDLTENTVANADYRRMMVESLQETFGWLRDPGSMPRHLQR